MQLPQPFVGVCGVQSGQKQARLVQRAANMVKGTGHFLMVGVKESRAFAVPSSVPDGVRYFAHCDFTPAEPYAQTITQNMSSMRSVVSGLQLNVLPWMEVDFSPLWRSLKQSNPGLALVLQAHRVIMQRYSPGQIARRLRGQAVDYILFDSSQSQGVTYGTEQMKRYVDAVCQQNLPIGVVVAGGLSGQTMKAQFQPLVKQYPMLSCDAYNRLCDITTQELAWPAVDQYLSSWSRSIAGVKQRGGGSLLVSANTAP